jgi:hypothetical protein
MCDNRLIILDGGSDKVETVFQARNLQNLKMLQAKGEADFPDYDGNELASAKCTCRLVTNPR